MIAVLQRVLKAEVKIEEKTKAKIKKADNFAGYSEEFISFVIENRRKPSKTKKKRIIKNYFTSINNLDKFIFNLYFKINFYLNSYYFHYGNFHTNEN